VFNPPLGKVHGKFVVGSEIEMQGLFILSLLFFSFFLFFFFLSNFFTVLVFQVAFGPEAFEVQS